MDRAQIKHIQDRIGVEVDGFWGPVSTLAAKSHLVKLMPIDSPFPTQREVSTDRSIYGRHGEPDGFSPPSEIITLPFPLHLYGKSDDKIRTLSVHPECASQMLGAFERLEKAYPSNSQREDSGLLNYFGVYNPRSIRGGSSWSMHAYRIAIDLHALGNRNKAHWPTGSSMPIEAMECFAKEGFTCAGGLWGRDAMHFQATSY